MSPNSITPPNQRRRVAFGAVVLVEILLDVLDHPLVDAINSEDVLGAAYGGGVDLDSEVGAQSASVAVQDSIAVAEDHIDLQVRHVFLEHLVELLHDGHLSMTLLEDGEGKESLLKGEEAWAVWDVSSALSTLLVDHLHRGVLHDHHAGHREVVERLLAERDIEASNVLDPLDVEAWVVFFDDFLLVLFLNSIKN